MAWRPRAEQPVYVAFLLQQDQRLAVHNSRATAQKAADQRHREQRRRHFALVVVHLVSAVLKHGTVGFLIRLEIAEGENLPHPLSAAGHEDMLM